MLHICPLQIDLPFEFDFVKRASKLWCIRTYNSPLMQTLAYHVFLKVSSERKIKTVSAFNPNKIMIALANSDSLKSKVLYLYRIKRFLILKIELELASVLHSSQITLFFYDLIRL